MKTILLTAFLSFNLFALGQLKHTTSVEAGLISSQQRLFTQSTYLFIESPRYYAKVNFDIDWKGFFVCTDLTTLMGKAEGVYFAPTSIEYEVKGGFRYKLLEIGVKHSCTHPVFNNDFELNTVKYRASYNKLYLRFTFKNY